MIGTHSVIAYTDRNAAGWGAPVFTNSYFATDMTGWTGEPFGESRWTWASGSVHLTANPGEQFPPVLIRTTGGVINRPPNVSEYRVRVVITAAVDIDLWAYLHFGTTAYGASVGPFWQPNACVQQAGGLRLKAGTNTAEFIFRQDNPPGSQYTFLGIGLRPGPRPDSPVPQLMSISSAEVHYRSKGTSADISCLVDEISIIHGRDDTSGQPDASAATIDFTATPEAPLPTLVDIGAVLTISTTTADGSFARFTGRVTDISLGWDDAGTDTPFSGIGQIVAVSLLADMARRVVGDQPWPQELDGARVARIADMAGEPLDPVWTDPGTVEIVPRDVDSQPALDLIHGVAESAGGIFWQTRSGDVRYADAEHRRGTPPSLLLDACDVLVTPRWMRNLAGLVNDISIGYGVAPEGGEQPRYTATNADSVSRYGRYELSVTTELAALEDAQAMGLLVLTRNSSPVWVLTALPIDLRDFDGDDTSRALSLEMHDLIQLTGMPAIGGAPVNASLWVEGWHERLAYGVHELELSVSGYCRTSPPPRWNDLPPDMTWDSVNQSMTWNDTTCLGPQPPGDHWDSVPASTRWDAVPASVTWDSYSPVTVGG